MFAFILIEAYIQTLSSVFHMQFSRLVKRGDGSTLNLGVQSGQKIQDWYFLTFSAFSQQKLWTVNDVQWMTPWKVTLERSSKVCRVGSSTTKHPRGSFQRAFKWVFLLDIIIDDPYFLLAKGTDCQGRFAVRNGKKILPDQLLSQKDPKNLF